MIGVGSKYDKIKEAVIFRKCLGLNDIKSLGTQKYNVETGETELIDCLNVTTTRDCCIEKTPSYSTAITHSAAVTSVSAGTRFIYQDGTDTKEWSKTVSTTPFAIVDGPVCHTPIDVRVSNGVSVYKSANGTSTSSMATAGDASAIPVTAKPYYKMPVYDKAFVYNAKLYTIEPTTKKFMLYSEDYNYDLFAIGDSHLSSSSEILDSGFVYSQKPDANGCIIWMHADAVSVLDGSGPHDFTNNYYPCVPIDKSLYSGWISKALGYGHVFLCADGVYMVSDDGVITNLTIGQTSYLNGLNSSVYCATVQDGKYLCYGESTCIEYDFFTKTVLKRSPEAVVSATTWSEVSYFAQGSLVTTLGSSMTSLRPASVVFPYSYLGCQGAKSISDLYFTGRFDDTLLITATDQDGAFWEKEIEGVGVCSNYRIKVPRRVLGNRISFSVYSESGAFRLEELRANLTESQRSR
jgi:hypothetical protein